MKTKSGNHVIFFCAAGPFFPSGVNNTPHNKMYIETGKGWFFQPSSWFPYSKNYGSPVNDLDEQLMQYSFSYSTASEALQEAENWEKKTQKDPNVDLMKVMCTWAEFTY